MEPRGVLMNSCQAVEDAHVLVVEVHVHIAVELALRGEQLARGRRVVGCEVAQHLADVGAGGAHLLLASNGGPQNRGYLDGGHRVND